MDATPKPRTPSDATGTARTGTLVDLVTRLQPGDVAVVDHADVDRAVAAAVVATGAVAVVSGTPFIGPAGASGPEVLAEAGLVLVDGAGPDLLDAVQDGQPVRVVDGAVLAVGVDDADPSEREALARGRVVDVELVRAELEAQRSELVAELDTLVVRSVEDAGLSADEVALGTVGLPSLRTGVRRRPAVVVGRVGPAEQDDLRVLRPFVRERGPALLCAGGASDALVAEGWVPDVVVVTGGEPASVPSADVLAVVGDVVLLEDGEAPSPERAALARRGISEPHVVTTPAAAGDVALLLAHREGASLLVGVGLTPTPGALTGARTGARTGEQAAARTDGDRRAEASYLTRLEVGSHLVDADTVRAAHTSRANTLQRVLLVLAGLTAFVALLSVTDAGRSWFDDLGTTFGGLL
jgi:uncharacterized membrane-anchored protein